MAPIARCFVRLSAIALVVLALAAPVSAQEVIVAGYGPPVVSYYQPTYVAPAVSYYTPSVAYYPVRTVSYSYPAVSYYSPAVSYYPGTVSATRYGLFGRPRVTRFYGPGFVGW